SYEGTPSGVRAWMWIWAPPSSTIRRASAAYSSGVYGIAAHWSRFATAPLMLQLRITGSSKRLIWVLQSRTRSRSSLYQVPRDGPDLIHERVELGARGLVIADEVKPQIDRLRHPADAQLLAVELDIRDLADVDPVRRLPQEPER